MILLGILSHFISDFVLQSKKLSNEKIERVFMGNLYHFIIVFITSVVVFNVYLIYENNQLTSFSVVMILLIISIIHFGIDVLKSLILNVKKHHPKWDLSLFFIDQFLHLLTIVYIFKLAREYIDLIYIRESFLPIVIILFIFVIYVGDVVIRKVLKVITTKTYEHKKEDIKGIGSYIGKIERSIILTMLMFNQGEIVLAIIGTKSIARFPELSKSENSNDYYVLGNLLSLLIVMIVFVIYKYFINNYFVVML